MGPAGVAGVRVVNVARNIGEALRGVCQADRVRLLTDALEYLRKRQPGEYEARCAQQGRAGDTPAELAAHEVANAMTAELLDE